MKLSTLLSFFTAFICLAVEPTLHLKFPQSAQTLTIGAKSIEIPAGDAEGWCGFGKRGLALPAAPLVGKGGTIIAHFRMEKPEVDIMLPRVIFSLRCLSRLVTGVCNIPNQGNCLTYQFGDNTTAPQTYLKPKPSFTYGEPHTCAITWNSARVCFYLDGLLYGDYAQAVPMEKLDRLVIAHDADRWYKSVPVSQDDFQLKELITYSEALQPAEVAKASGVALVPPSSALDGCLTIPLRAEAPALDAKLDDAVWSRAATLPELETIKSRFQGYESPASHLAFTATNTHLHIAFEYAFPAGNTVEAGQLRTPALEPEVWGSESWEFYLKLNGHLYRFAGNAAGGYTESVDMENKWNPEWRYVSNLAMLIDNSQVWRGEIAIPWSTLNLNGAPTEPFQLNWCRSWFIGDFGAPTALYGTGNYRDNSRFLTARVSPQPAVFQQDERPNPTTGTLRQNGRIHAPQNAKVEYDISVMRQDGSAAPKTLFNKAVTIGSEGSASLTVDAPLPSPLYDLVRYTLLMGGVPQMRTYAPYRYKPVPMEAKPLYLSGKINVKLNLALLGITTQDNAVLCLVSPQGKELVRLPVNGDNLALPFDSAQPKGNYVVKAVSAAGKELASIMLDYPGLGSWHTATYKPDVVLPPFTPLQSNEKEGAYFLWGRTYRYGNAHFPRQITSQEESLLSAPVQLIANGKPLGEKATTADFKATPTTATFTTSSTDALCEMTSHAEVHYDGVTYHRVHIAAHSALNDLHLELPIPPDQMRFLHAAIGGGWGRKQTITIPDGTTAFAFFPIMWIGMQERGLCFFTQHHHGWTGDNKSVMVVEKSNGKALLRINLRKLLKEGEAFEFEFGLQATPIRPLPKDYPMNVVDYYHTPLMNRPEARYPVNSITINGNWPHEYEAFFADLPSLEAPSMDGYYKKCLAVREKVHNRAIIYMDAMMLNDRYPDVAAFRPEWQQVPTVNLDYIIDGRKYQVFSSCPATDANAYYVEKAASVLKRYKFDGLYFDFGLNGVCNNQLHGHQEFWPLLAMREFYRRIALAEVENGITEPIIVLHNTDFVMPPVVSFATHLLNGEHIRQHSSTIMHNGKDIQDTYGLEMFASELSTLPFGLTSAIYQANDYLLPEFGGGKEEHDLYKFRITKAFLAGALPHNSMLSPLRCHYGIFDKLFRVYERFDVPQARFTGYWRNPATIEGAQNIYVSCYTSPDGKRLLAVISHIGKEHLNQDFTVTFNPAVLGLTSKPATALDTLPAPDPEYDTLLPTRNRLKIHYTRAPLKLGDFGSRIISYDSSTLQLKFHLDFHSFAIVELK